MLTTPVLIHVAPQFINPKELAGGFVIVIDLLRASTTIVHALAAGAARVIPCEGIDEAKETAAALRDSVLGGERKGIRIEGFELGNSPSEYTPERVGGRVVVLTTTNGTRAVRHASVAGRVVIGCFANFGAVVDTAVSAVRKGMRAHALCAGIDGQACDEDLLCAAAFEAAVADRLCVPGRDELVLSSVFRRIRRGRDLPSVLTETAGGRNLASIGLSDDIAVCAAVDSRPVLPVFDPALGEIRIEV